MSKIYIAIILCAVTCFKSFAQADLVKPNRTKLKREFRGVWVATVENIDWPNKPGESTMQQQDEMLKLLDAHQQIGINAIIFQIRPAADAFYAKSSEPWSKYLTGQQGKAPDPFYDPLQFTIDEAHKRGMELHAWINPYRATKDGNFASLSPQHITNIKPEWFFIYEGMKLFNPGLPEVRAYIVKVVLNIVDQYDVDGIHMDDYFYPYPAKGQKIMDEASFKQYGQGFASIDDWRRNNVDQLIKTLSDSIHSHKPRMKFGVSPFSIWANRYQNPEGSDSHGGNTYYNQYADSRKWVMKGWVDYNVPQIYRPIHDTLVDFHKMIDWWGLNTYNRHLYIGQAPYRIIENKLPLYRNPAEIPNQIQYLRNNLRVQGSVFFSSNTLVKNPLGVTDSLKNNFYRYPALPPVMLWLDSIAPNPPLNLKVKAEDKRNLLMWDVPELALDKEAVYGYVIYRFQKDEAININDPSHILRILYGTETSFTDLTGKPEQEYIYVVTALDRLKNESEPAVPAAQTR